MTARLEIQKVSSRGVGPKSRNRSLPRIRPAGFNTVAAVDEEEDPYAVSGRKHYLVRKIKDDQIKQRNKELQDDFRTDLFREQRLRNKIKSVLRAASQNNKAPAMFATAFN